MLIFPLKILAGVQVGATVPNFELESSKGEKFLLSDYKDKLVVLEWTNHQCPYVRKHYRTRNMQKLQKKYRQKGVVWFSVISSSKGRQGHVSSSKANDLTESRDAHPTAVLIDESGKVGRLYGARTTPHMYIVNKGELAYMGAIDSIPTSDQDDLKDAKNYVAAALDEILAGKEVSTTKSRPYGCSVKY